MTGILSHKGVEFNSRTETIKLNGTSILTAQEFYNLTKEAFSQDEFLLVTFPIEVWESEDTVYFCCDWLVIGPILQETVGGMRHVLVSPMEAKGP